MFKEVQWVMNSRKIKSIVELIEYQLIKIPLTNQRYYRYTFRDVESNILIKTTMEKKRNTLKGVVEGDTMEIVFFDVQRIAENKYEAKKIRVLNNEIY